MSQATLFVRFTQQGYHKWPDGPEYLRNRHRHLFHIEVSLDSTVDGKRSVEFHRLLAHSRNVLRDIGVRGTFYEYGDMSCEQMADAMARRLANSYSRVVSVSVSEDGECGAIVSHDPEWEDESDTMVD